MKGILPWLLIASLFWACGQPNDPRVSDPTTPGPDTTAPADAKPTAFPGNARINLVWDEPADGDFASVVISVTGLADVTVGKGTNYHIFTNLTNGVSYTFTLRSLDVTGNRSGGASVVSKPDPAVATDASAPDKVTLLRATGGDSQVSLSWTAPSNTDFASVEVSAADIAAVKVDRGTNTCVVTGLVNGKTYIFTVKSADFSGNKSAGSTIGALPLKAAQGDLSGIIY